MWSTESAIAQTPERPLPCSTAPEVSDVHPADSRSSRLALPAYRGPPQTASPRCLTTGRTDGRSARPTPACLLHLGSDWDRRCRGSDVDQMWMKMLVPDAGVRLPWYHRCEVHLPGIRPGSGWDQARIVPVRLVDGAIAVENKSSDRLA